MSKEALTPQPSRFQKGHKDMSEQKPSWMQLADIWLSQILPWKDGESDDQWVTRVKAQIKAKLLESYRNGQAAGPTKRVFRPTQKQTPK